MVTVEPVSNNTLLCKTHIITYGNAADILVTEYIRQEIEQMWNEPQGSILFRGNAYRLLFEISAEHKPVLEEDEVLMNVDPKNNYFRIESFAAGNISFVDALGSNTGYFLIENLYQGSTTAAHEFGHTLGLKHPDDLDIRGLGIPGIMYPRGTLVDAQYQYDPAKMPGEKGGTMHPIYRKVKKEDVSKLKISALINDRNTYVIGDFTNIWHEAHTPSGA